MDRAQAERAVGAALATVVPGVVLDGIAPTDDLRELLDLDSLDFLDLVESLAGLTGVEVLEVDYGRVRTLEELSSYLVERGA